MCKRSAKTSPTPNRFITRSSLKSEISDLKIVLYVPCVLFVLYVPASPCPSMFPRNVHISVSENQ